MAKEYRLGFVRRTINTYVTAQIRKGKMADNMYLLTTLGRKSGAERTTPVTLLFADGDRYVVSPYGNVGWVYNVRSSPLAEISRGGKKEEIALEELDPESAGPILKQYVQEVSVVRSFFDAGPDSPVTDFIVEADRHPVFRIS